MKPAISKLGALSDRDLDWINANGTIETIGKGENLICQGQIINKLYILLTGKFNVFISASTPGNSTVQTEISVSAIGEIMGEISFVDKLPPVATVRAIEESTALGLSWQQLKHKIQQDEGFSARFYQTLSALLSHRLRQNSSLLVQSQIVAEPPLRKVLLVFGILNDRDIDWLIENGLRVNASPKKVLIQQGKPVEALYIPIDGTLAVSITVDEGNTKVSKEIAKLSSGEIVGEMSFVEAGKASATVESFDRSILLAIPQKELEIKLKEDMQFAARFYRAIAVVLADRLRDGLSRRGYGQNYAFSDMDEDIELDSQDELDLNTLKNTALAGTRFNWMSRRINGRY